jgi:chaperonin cofactor prefoldin
MPLCGFNEKMLKGLADFNEGLVEHGLKYRSEKNDETIDQAIKREISDMTRLLLEIHRIDDNAKRVMTEGIAKYAMGFYLIMRKNDIDDYKEVIDKIGEYFKYMDDKYYSELEGRPEDMKELTESLDKKQI